MISFFGDGVGLFFVFGYVGVDVFDDIWVDRGVEDFGEDFSGVGGFVIGVENGDSWFGGYFVWCWDKC